MGYEHDIFISYKRDPEALEWIRRFLKPLLTHRVQMELKRPVMVYVHEVGNQIAAGTAWPVELGEVIARSRVLVALWSGDYLSSEWCRQELSLMLQREQRSRARSARNKFGLVIPIVAHDGETIPQRLAAAQKLEVFEYFNSRMPSDGAKAEKLADLIALHAKGIAAAIKAAPRWHQQWPRRAARQLLRAFNTRQRTQRTLPRFNRQ
jgi:TIR domain